MYQSCWGGIAATFSMYTAEIMVLDKQEFTGSELNCQSRDWYVTSVQILSSNLQDIDLYT
jgi:hypothetical protein